MRGKGCEEAIDEKENVSRCVCVCVCVCVCGRARE